MKRSTKSSQIIAGKHPRSAI